MYFLKGDKTAFVGTGFNWFAFVFVWGWLLSRGLWKQGVITTLFYIPIYFLSSSLNLKFMDGIKQDELVFLIPLLILLVVHLYIGMRANQWREALLLEQGYKKT